MVEHPLDPNSYNVDASVELKLSIIESFTDVKPNIVDSSIDVEPNDVEVSIDLKSNVDFKEIIVKPDEYLNDLVPISTIEKFLACIYVFTDMALGGLILSNAADYIIEKQ
ncbi:hypothetical protein MTR_4g133820 [Medicago truncatula]|uniref:Uncharacterized protein n=1 Tax=Medicago truncatula TaxID=3880 RepID=G7JMW1_MEDTR|nr:hypothetical protein MTR_4g133820 [Medicago truncatula]